MKNKEECVMHCKNCLAPLNADDTYCKVCGTPIDRKENYPSNEEIIKAYNNETMRVPAQGQGTENRSVSNESMASDFRNLERQEEKIQSSAQSIENTYNMEATTSLPQHEPILVAEPKSLVIPKREEIEEEPLPKLDTKKEEKGISKKTLFLSIFIVMMITALVTTLICIPIFSKVDNKKETSDNPKVDIKTVTENRILFSGYSFVIPEGYSYKINGTQLLVEKKDTKEAMSLQIGQGTYENMKANLTSVKKNLTDAKWTVGKLYVDQTIDERNYLTVEATVNKQKVMIAYTTADDTQVFGIIYLNPTATDYPSDTVESFSKIIDSGLKVNNPVNTNIADFTKNKILFTITGTDKPNQGGTTQGGTQSGAQQTTPPNQQTGTQTNQRSGTKPSGQTGTQTSVKTDKQPTTDTNKQTSTTKNE